MNCPKWLRTPIRGLILDISGVLKDSDIPISGSIEAILKLQKSNIPFCLVSNETTSTTSELATKLKSIGYDIPESKIITPVPVVKDLLKKNNLRPYLLLQSSVKAEFSDCDLNNPNCVVIGDIEDGFNYETLNDCFRKLMSMEKPLIYSLGIGKYYKDNTGLVLDVGAFTKGLEYATGVVVKVVGKPDPEYFRAALQQLSLNAEEVAMIGDDIEFDIGGAQASGIRGILVKTGKFLPSNENHPSVKPDAIVDNLAEAVNTILNHNKTA